MVNSKESDGNSLMSWELLIRNIIAQIIMMFLLKIMVLNVDHHQDSGNIMSGLTLQIFMDSLSGILDTSQVEDLQMIEYKLIDGNQDSNRFKGQLVKMIKYVGGRFDDYLISPKI